VVVHGDDIWSVDLIFIIQITWESSNIPTTDSVAAVLGYNMTENLLCIVSACMLMSSLDK